MPLKKARLRISDYNQSRKVRLMKHERRTRVASLSLTSMVDMFAILVIFLLVNTSSTPQSLDVAHDIQLPRTKFSSVPPKAASLQVARDAMYGDNGALATLPQIMNGPMIITSLKTWLASKSKEGGYINIMAHEKIPFGAIKKVVATCQDAGFSNVNLIIQPK